MWSVSRALRGASEKVGGTLPRMPGREQGSGHSHSFPFPGPMGEQEETGGAEKGTENGDLLLGPRGPGLWAQGGSEPQTRIGSNLPDQLHIPSSLGSGSEAPNELLLYCFVSLCISGPASHSPGQRRPRLPLTKEEGDELHKRTWPLVVLFWWGFVCFLAEP